MFAERSNKWHKNKTVFPDKRLSQHLNTVFTSLLPKIQSSTSTSWLPQLSASEPDTATAHVMPAKTLTEELQPIPEHPPLTRCPCSCPEMTRSQQLSMPPYGTPPRSPSHLLQRALSVIIPTAQLRSLTPTTRTLLLVVSLMVMILMQEYTITTKC